MVNIYCKGKVHVLCKLQGDLKKLEDIHQLTVNLSHIVYVYYSDD